MDGRTNAPIARIYHAGSYSIPFSTELPSGAYLLVMRTSGGSISKLVEVIK